MSKQEVCSPANTCRPFWYSQQDSVMSVGWLQGPRLMWLHNSDFSGPFMIMRKLFPNTTIKEDSTHLTRRGMRTLTPGHSMIKTFMRGLSACIFDSHQPDVVALKACLTRDGKSDASIEALPSNGYMT